MHSYTAAAGAPLPLVNFSPEDPFGSEEWLCALRLLFSNSAELLTACHYLFCKQYSQVGYFVVGAPLSGCLLLLLLQNCSLTSGLCGDLFVLGLQLSGFVIAAGVGMLATCDTGCGTRICLRPSAGKATGEIRTSLLEHHLWKAERDSGNIDRNVVDASGVTLISVF